MIMKNLSDTYYDHIYLLPISTFDQLLEAGVKIEDNDRPRRDEHRGRRPASNRANEGPEINALSPIPQRSKKRNFSDLGMPLSQALQKLMERGKLEPLAPTPPPNPLPSYYDASKFCAFHQNPGHDTDRCQRLRHEIQNLIDDKVISAPNHHAIPLQ